MYDTTNMPDDKTHASSTIEQIRSASRELVRELGFMNLNLAGSDLSPSGVHALLQLQSHEGLSAGQLSEQLLLEKSTVSRLVRALVRRGEIRAVPSSGDRRVKHLDLTDKGSATAARINRFATDQVRSAIAPLDAHAQQAVVGGLQAYATALRASRVGENLPSKENAVRIIAGYQPGLIGKIVTMHAAAYNKLEGFGSDFEAKVAEGLAAFAPRLGKARNQLWTAQSAGYFLGSIAIDGEGLGNDIAHLRWFLVAEEARGTGVGRTLLETAITHCRNEEFAAIKLWTFKGLDAARMLYEGHGFVLTEEYSGNQWGHRRTEQVFVKTLNG